VSIARAFRPLLITDGRGEVPRIEAIVGAAIDGGVRAVQVREPGLGARQLATLCARLRARMPVGGLVLVNDRVDVAAAGCADGVHLGGRSLAPADARRVLGPHALIGFSAHDADELASAVAQGASYATLSPLFPTASKPGAPALGLERALALAGAAALPVVLLGGIDTGRARELRGRWPGAVAVLSAICSAPDPRAAAAALVDALGAQEAGA
jgi:thiamine-phosphate pyrophosphorylase